MKTRRSNGSVIDFTIGQSLGEPQGRANTEQTRSFRLPEDFFGVKFPASTATNQEGRELEPPGVLTEIGFRLWASNLGENVGGRIRRRGGVRGTAQGDRGR